jgi:hypothetical protein
MHNTIKHLLEDRFYHNTAIKDKLITLSKQVQNGEVHAVKAAYELVNNGI